MQLANAQIERHSSGVESSIKFRVATNAKMMKMLSDNLYSDKIMAPIRELSTNALDSHIGAGCPTKPFHVHLPCNTNPEFRIRDYGMGMTQEAMEDLYTTYGESDKNNSNDFVGCMGLGSKSPFAYTDSFTATSYKDGMKYVYIAGRDSTGIPTLNRMVTEPTTEPNGLEISFGVRKEHFQNFYDKARQLYRNFPVMPEVSGYATSVANTARTILLQGTGWRIYKDGGYDSHAIMGYIQYPINPAHFSKNAGSSYGYSRYSSDESQEVELLKLGLEIHFPIGAIEMDISRESLQYNKVTIDEIKARLNVIADEIKVLVSEHFKACNTIWEARCLYHELFYYGPLSGLKNITKVVGTQWRGLDINRPLTVQTNEHLDLVHVSNGKAFTRRRVQNHIQFSKTTKFYVNDLKKGAYAIAERDSHSGTDIWLSTFSGTDGEIANARKAYCDHIGINESSLVYVSTLPAAKTASVTGPRKTKQFTFSNKIASGGYSYAPRSQAEWWMQKEIDLNDGGYYVPLSGFSVMHGKDNSQSTDARGLGTMLNHAKTLGIKLPNTICGIRPSHVEKIKDNPDWINLFTYIREELDKFVQNNNYVDALDELTNLSGVNSNRLDNFVTANNNNEFDRTKPFGNFMTNYSRIVKLQKKIGDKVDPLTKLAEVVKYTLPKTGNTFNCTKEHAKLEETYPMFNFVSYYLQGRQIKAIVNYINLVDSTNP